MANPNAVVRMEKNLDEIRGLISDLNKVVSEYNDITITGDVDYGHVASVARIRSLLNEALRREDKDPK
jgi:hypothetical protein